jgi:hypothetical protein
MTPLTLPAPRVPEAARIRIGGPSEGRGFGKALKTFRFTGTQQVCGVLAEHYGGTPQEWQDGAWQVITEVSSVPVILPRDLPVTPQGCGEAFAQSYELWDAGGRLHRRCDANTCEEHSYEEGPDGPDRITTIAPCMCQRLEAEGKPIECAIKARLTVRLRGVNLGGVLLLTSSSRMFAAETSGAIQFARAEHGDDGSLSGHLTLVEQSSPRTGYTYRIAKLELRPPTGLEPAPVPALPNEPPPAPKPLSDDSRGLPVDPPPPKAPRRSRKPSTAAVPAHIARLGNVANAADALVGWTECVGNADTPEALQTLRSYWLIWSQKNPDMGTAIGRDVSALLRPARGS